MCMAKTVITVCLCVFIYPLFNAMMTVSLGICWLVFKRCVNGVDAERECVRVHVRVCVRACMLACLCVCVCVRIGQPAYFIKLQLFMEPYGPRRTAERRLRAKQPHVMIDLQ